MDSLFPGNHRCVAGTGALQPNITSRSADSVFTNGGSPESVPVHASGEMHQCSILPEVLDDASVSDIQKAQFEYLFVSKVDAMTIGDLYRLYDFNRGGR